MATKIEGVWIYPENLRRALVFRKLLLEEVRSMPSEENQIRQILVKLEKKYYE